MLDLDGFFGLHPAIASFEPLWKQKHLAIVHAAGSPDPISENEPGPLEKLLARSTLGREESGLARPSLD
ncbi:MAG: hypothetical protein ACLPVW_19300 [Terriglobales bacterium]